ncbi:MAG TPA: hypothetical protein DIC18_01215 [Clostridiales bacterium]|nr:hypothetical protein [Clostridiales bacterium]HCU55936.1 hypothetical protein [Clostridiales bacterium]
MLNKKESALMRVIYKKTTRNKGMCLIRPVELMVGISYGLDFKEEDLEPTMKALIYDEYIDLVESDKKGDFYYCITLLKKGFAFQRSEEQRLRARRSKIISKVLLALLGGAVTILLTRVIVPLFFK